MFALQKSLFHAYVFACSSVFVSAAVFSFALERHSLLFAAPFAMARFLRSFSFFIEKTEGPAEGHNLEGFAEYHKLEGPPGPQTEGLPGPQPEGSAGVHKPVGGNVLSLPSSLEGSAGVPEPVGGNILGLPSRSEPIELSIKATTEGNADHFANAAAGEEAACCLCDVEGGNAVHFEVAAVKARSK